MKIFKYILGVLLVIGIAFSAKSILTPATISQEVDNLVEVQEQAEEVVGSDYDKELTDTQVDKSNETAIHEENGANDTESKTGEDAGSTNEKIVLLSHEAGVNQNTEDNTSLLAHQVQKGESIFLISQQYGVNVDDIYMVNNLSSDEIIVGQNLLLPEKAELKKAPVNNSSSATHRVSKGESIFLIARQYGVAPTDLKKANNLDSDEILVGQVLTLPANSSKQTMQTASRNTTASRFTEDDIYWLAKIIYSEARGEIYEGQVAVGAVVLNRVKSSIFPNSVYGVIFEKWDNKYYQFSPVLDGTINLEPNATANKAAREAINGWDPSGGALYFYNPITSTNRWIYDLPIIKKIGKHVFA